MNKTYNINEVQKINCIKDNRLSSDPLSDLCTDGGFPILYKMKINVQTQKKLQAFSHLSKQSAIVGQTLATIAEKTTDL